MSGRLLTDKTDQEKKEILKSYNNILHDALSRNEIVIMAAHSRKDPRIFTIIADNDYERKLEGIDLIFTDPKDFTRVFPEYATPPPSGSLSPNTERDPVTGKIMGSHRDPYHIKRYHSYPPVTDPEHVPENAGDNDPQKYWSVNKIGASLILDLGFDADVGTVWIAWNAGDRRRFKFTVSVALARQITKEDKSFTMISHLENRYSSGETDTLEPYNLSTDPGLLTKARYIMISVYGNTGITNPDIAEINSVMVTRTVSVKSSEADLLKEGEEEEREKEKEKEG